MLITFLKGLGTGSGLIIAIGAQNAFVLSQGVKKQYFFIIPLICSLCDAILITLGVTGVGNIIASNRLLSQVAGIGGAVFLFVYGCFAFKSAIKGGSLEASAQGRMSLKVAILTTLAVTLLNPHVYIDTIILMGSIAGQFQDTERIFFGAGAATASFIWFFSLSLGGGLLAPVFKKQIAWRVLDTAVGMIMWVIAVSVLRGIGGP